MGSHPAHALTTTALTTAPAAPAERTTTMPNPTISLSHLKKSFGDVQAVVDVSFEVFPGEIFGLLGPNGAGKTTSIRMMLDIFRPDAGEALVFGGRMDEAKKNRIGYMPEDRGLYKDQKLEQVLVYLATLKGLDEKTARQRLVGWLKRLDLFDHRQKRVQDLSKGMQQKAQLIATLIHEPDLIVVDEPFSGLDPVNTRLVIQIMAEQRQAGRTILMSTHQMHQVEALCNRIVLIDRGRSVLYGPVDEIKRRFASDAVVVRGEGDFGQLPGVLEARQVDGSWHLALAPGVSAQAVLRGLAAGDGYRVERFELAEPSLDDIFITVVQGQRTAEEAARG
ncbi:MAG: ATP-binding cassette domain-containing protein [Caldilineales bacterium]|nr:ATP-binding cassette domain-containing protein [Caldilineales bacterium]MCW5861240.1 ATP-binding cassette domain-containing protein [Caldilineales bacterium]